MIKVITPPNAFTPMSGVKSVFLGGTIDMGKSLDWQSLLISLLEKRITKEVTVYNPRRPDWDSSWKQVPGDNPFTEQVNWELDYLAKTDINVFYFAPGSSSPITLLELGWSTIRTDQPKIVFCKDSYQRYGNVKIFCDRMGIKVIENFEEFIVALATELNK